MAKELFNHEIHEIHEKEKGERVRTTNGHEWTKAGVNHEKHETHEKNEGRVRTTNGQRQG